MLFLAVDGYIIYGFINQFGFKGFIVFFVAGKVAVMVLKPEKGIQTGHVPFFMSHHFYLNRLRASHQAVIIMTIKYLFQTTLHNYGK